MNKYIASEEFLSRSLSVIPLGSQTFSKSYMHYPKGASPFFMERGKGAYCWDIDGNKYLDMVNALAAVTLGYHDDDVDSAVIKQIKKGTIFSLPGEAETFLAELLISIVPSAEMVRFGKNASDATSAAVRIARASTSRDKIAVCGYHGWHDWYISSTSKNLGVPSLVGSLTKSFLYNDINSLHSLFKQDPDGYAAVIMEPMNIEYPKDDFLHEVKALCKQFGVLLIFDETVTGFRLHNQGAQGLFGVIPDLSCFGKGMANGYPISAVVGSKEYMRLLDHVFFSFTYGGDLIGIEAARASINKIINDDVITSISKKGSSIKARVNSIIESEGLTGYLNISGHDAWSFLNFSIDDENLLYEIKTLFMQETLSNGLISLCTHNLSFSHSDEDIETLIRIYSSIFPMIKDSLNKGSAKHLLHCESLKPLFKVRR